MRTGPIPRLVLMTATTQQAVAAVRPTPFSPARNGVTR